MATGASSFSGSTIMPSQWQHAGTAPDYPATAVRAPSPAKSCDPRFAGCTPTTVRHLARSIAAALAAVAAAGGGDPFIIIDGVEVTNVRVVGRVVSVVNTEAFVSFTLDDGTGKIALTRWVTDRIGALEAAFVQNGVYLKVQVSLVGFQAKQQGQNARSIRPVTNFNEVPLHFIECIHVHLENVWPKLQALRSQAAKANTSFHEMPGQFPHAVQTNAPAYVSFSGGARDQVHLAQVNQGRFPMSVQPNASTHMPFSGGVREQHNHFTPQPNQFSAYPGTGGQQHDLQLQSKILDVMHQPDIIALENGVHADELARRLGVPKAQIMKTARRLQDLAYLYSTIDEFHFRSTSTVDPCK